MIYINLLNSESNYNWNIEINEIYRYFLISLSSEEIIQTEGGPQIRNFGAPTLIDALQKSGGITQDANLFKIILIRKMSGEKGNLKRTTIDLHQFLKVIHQWLFHHYDSKQTDKNIFPF